MFSHSATGDIISEQLNHMLTDLQLFGVDKHELAKKNSKNT